MRLWEGEQWVAKCKVCKNVISSGWVTFHQEHDEEEGSDPWVAYCYECDHMDPMWTDEKGKVHWTLRVRCQHYWTQCENTWQSCRDKGSSPHVKCLNWWGWRKSCKAVVLLSTGCSSAAKHWLGFINACMVCGLSASNASQHHCCRASDSSLLRRDGFRLFRHALRRFEHRCSRQQRLLDLVG